ncbi:MAG: serine protease [Clostridiales bacterium]
MYNKNVKRNVCRVKSEDNRGTGFLVSDTQVLTARHCIASGFEKEIILEFLYNGEKKINLCATLDDSSDNRIAILNISQPQKFKHLQIAKMDLKRSYKGETFGYPEVLKTTGNWIDYKINTVIDNKNDDELNYSIILEIEPSCRISDFSGLSGAPLIFDETIVGVITLQSTESNKALVIKAFDLKKCEVYLSKNGLTLPVKKKKSDEPSKGIHIKNSNKTNLSGNKIKGSIINFGNMDYKE